MTTTTSSSESLVERLADSMAGAFDLVAVYLGHELGFYRALANDGAATSAQVAERTNTTERYVREWLEQQAVTGLLAVDDPSAAPDERVFSLPKAYESVLADAESSLAMGHIAQIFIGTITPLGALVEAFRTGAGVPYDAYGPDLSVAQARYNRPMLLERLAQDYIPAMPDIHARLQADPPAKVADIGMGMGWSSIGLALGYPTILVDGFDLDSFSVERAAEHAASAGVSDRVRFQCRDAGDPALAGQYDFALAVECIHDMARPVEVLRAMRRLVGPGGTVLIVDDKPAATFQPNGDRSERILYGFSILHCLPIGMVEQPSAATGAAMRPDTFRGYAAEAGFQQVDILAVDNDDFYFYRLTA